ncbi:MAG: ROK family protein, partial [Bifidobacteriaceae bacterium]|jgi:predicted NBD/HSP70 family sugar kinase|nr:ROK family protein [Bifidobacteriaceae bacterium]
MPSTQRLALTAASASQASLRRHNLALIYGLIARASGPLSRAQLAEAAGVTRATAGALVDRMVEARLVEELAPDTSGRAGRPARPVRLARGTFAGIGLEVNVDYLAVRGIDLAGETLAERISHVEVAGTCPAATIRALADLAAPVRRRLNAHHCRIVGTTLAVAGLVDRQTGYLRTAPNLGWRGVDLMGLARAAGLAGELAVDNEAALAARSELAASAERGPDFVYVSGGIGIGAGIVRGGAVARGAHGWAGELGHMTVDPAGPLCACGATGCLERYAGRRAILAAALGPAGSAAPGEKTGTKPGATVAPAPGGAVVPGTSLDDAVRLATARDPQALAALGNAGRALGVALAGALNFADLGTVVLGGDFAEFAPFLIPALQAELSRRVVSWGWSPSDQVIRVAAARHLPALTGAGLTATDLVAANPKAYLT